jgi:hypothetical protein
MTLGASADRGISSSQMRSISSPRRPTRPEAVIEFAASAAGVQRGASIDATADHVASRRMIAQQEKPIP